MSSDGSNALQAAFQQLLPPKGRGNGERYQTIQLRDEPRVQIGKGRGGEPCIIIDDVSAREGAVRMPIELEHIVVRYRCDVEIYTSSTRRVGKAVATVIGLREGSSEFTNAFLDVASVFADSLGAHPTQEQVYEQVGRLLELFRARTRPALGSVQGLWAELFLIACATRMQEAARAWHSDPSDVHDFADQGQRLEVKSTRRAERKHTFTHAQLTPLAKQQIFVASVQVLESQTGVSIAHLLDRVAAELGGGEDTARVESIAMATLASNWTQGSRERFDFQTAIDTLRLYDASNVPRLSCKIPLGVSDVTFVSDLATSRHVTTSVWRRLGGLAGYVAPLPRARLLNDR